MRIDPNFIVFVGHFEWYYLDKEKDYIPKDDAPEEVKQAIERFNKYTFDKKTEASAKE